MRTHVPVEAEGSEEQKEQAELAAQVAHVEKVGQTSTTGHDEMEKLLAEKGAVHVALLGTQEPLAPEAPQNWHRELPAQALQDDESEAHSAPSVALQIWAVGRMIEEKMTFGYGHALLPREMHVAASESEVAPQSWQLLSPRHAEQPWPL